MSPPHTDRLAAPRADLSGRLWANGPLLLAVANLLWAGSIVMGRAAAAQIPPSLFTLLRWGGALLVLLPFAWPHLQRDLPRLLRHWKLITVYGVLGTSTYNNLVYHGLHSTTAVNALLLQSATPLFVIVALFCLFGDRPSRRQTAAIALSLGGVVVIAAEGSWAMLQQLRFNHGDVLVGIGVAGYAIYSALLRRRPAVHPFSLLTASIAAGLVVLLPLAAWEYADGARLIPTPLAITSIIYAALLAAALAYLCYNRGVELVGPARAGQYLHLMPVFGVVLAVIFLGEALHPYHLLGIALIAAGLWLAR